jgi:hypothetical protein
MNLNSAGEMVEQTWQQLPQRFPHIRIDEFVVMPDVVCGCPMTRSHSPYFLYNQLPTKTKGAQ